MKNRFLWVVMLALVLSFMVPVAASAGSTYSGVILVGTGQTSHSNVTADLNNGITEDVVYKDATSTGFTVASGSNTCTGNTGSTTQICGDVMYFPHWGEGYVLIFARVGAVNVPYTVQFTP